MSHNKEYKEFKQYKEYIIDLAATAKNCTFFNSGPEHAALVMGTIFSKSTETVKIYAGGFTGEVSEKEDYRDGMEKFLRNGGRVQILLQEEKFNSTKEPKIFELLRYYQLINPSQVTIKQHPFKLFKGEGEVHFTVADDKMYRLEDDIVKFTAVGNFNDVSKSKELSSIFDDLFSNTEAKTLYLVNPKNISN